MSLLEVFNIFMCVCVILGLCSGCLCTKLIPFSYSSLFFILFFSPALAVLAHELMHAYMRQNKFFDIAPHIEEV